MSEYPKPIAITLSKTQRKQGSKEYYFGPNKPLKTEAEALAKAKEENPRKKIFYRLVATDFFKAYAERIND